MLENDIYVSHSDLGIRTIEQMLEFLNKNLSFEGKDLQDAALVLCAYSFYITHEEISVVFPIYPAFSHISTRVFAPLVRKGYMTSEKAASRKEMEGTSKVFYSVTAQGYQYANSLCHGKLTTKYKKNRAKIAKSHTYYIGYNFFQLLMLGFPMTWQREYIFGRTSFSQRVSALQVDGLCELYKSFGEKPFYELYIEQDLCTEHNDILVGKLQNYADYGLMDYPTRSAIIFSLSQKGVTVGANGSLNTTHPYSDSKCDKLLAYMKEMHLDDLYDAYITGFPDRKFIEQLMLKVGAAKETENGLKRGRNRFSDEDVREFRDLIRQKRNPYEHREFNITRSNIARSRLEEMVKLIYAHSHTTELFLTRILRGYQICYLATTLVADRVKYAMLAHFPDEQKLLELSLSIFGNVKFENEISEPIILSAGSKLTLRNHFTSDQGEIFVEFPSADVGAWVRAAYFIQRRQTTDKKTLVLVFETPQQLADFYRANNCYIDEYDVKQGGVISLMFYSIGMEKKLFYLSDASGKRNYIKTDR